LDIIENTGDSIFITGRAGTGKSTLLNYFKNTTKKKVIVLAPTGVAALNVKGQTIHSFFRFRPNITPERIRRRNFKNEKENIYNKIDAVVIDEISMVRADLLDCVDYFLRLNGPDIQKPFGGIQMIFIGDLYQLPPVITGEEKELFHSIYDSPYFYSAKVFNSLEMEFVELEKVYRQHDAGFINLLNSIRNKTITEEQLSLLNQRCLTDFEPPPGEMYIYLTTTNAVAEQINSQRLAELKGKVHVFPAVVEGDFGDEYLPTATTLRVKTGAQIMMLNNDIMGRWVNGSLGEIVRIEHGVSGESVIIVELTDGAIVEVTPYSWEIYSYFVSGGQLQSDIIGSFTQYPLMLAWAVTIHKSQGKTFAKVIIDFGKGTFAHGQAYVALSRCTSLEGIVLRQPVLNQHIKMDFDVVRFLTKYQYKRADEAYPLNDKVAAIKRAIENKIPLQITYLKPNDEKSRRVILPREIGEMEYRGKSYLGIKAFCYTRKEDRTFRVDRILEMEEIDND
jgi:ATP-dependent DNA helicase PIF1